MPSLLSEFWQYLKDAAPGGALNPETPKLGGLINKGAEELAASLREYGKANKAAIDNPSWANVKRSVDANMMAAGMAPLGLTVYHGSPHKFSKFDMSKIGTGEGAQAYGHGLYMAESPDVARQYAQTLDPMAQTARSSIDAEGTAARVLQAVDYNKQKAIEELTRRKNMTHVQGDAEWAAKMDAAIAHIKGADKTSQLYKVDIPDEAVARMLDWDKKLSEQAPEVRAYAEKVLASEIQSAKSSANGWGDLSKPFSLMDEMTGSQFLQRLRDGKSTVDNILGGGGNDVSNALRQGGIPGIRYLDGGSRSAGQGSSNFVLFDDQLPRILETNGVPTGNQPWKPGEWGAATPAAMGAALGAGLLGAGGVAAYENPSLLRDLFSGASPEPDKQNWLQKMLIPQTHSRPGGVRG